MKLVIAEKPSVAKSIANAIGAHKKTDAAFEGNGYICLLYTSDAADE